MIDHNFQPLGTTQDKVGHLLALVFLPFMTWNACMHLLDWHDGMGKSAIIPCVLIAIVIGLSMINMVRTLMSFSLHAALSDEGIQIKSGDQIQTYSFSDTQTVFKKDFGGLQIAKSGASVFIPLASKSVAAQLKGHSSISWSRAPLFLIIMGLIVALVVSEVVIFVF